MQDSWWFRSPAAGGSGRWYPCPCPLVEFGEVLANWLIDWRISDPQSVQVRIFRVPYDIWPRGGTTWTIVEKGTRPAPEEVTPSSGPEGHPRYTKLKCAALREALWSYMSWCHLRTAHWVDPARVCVVSEGANQRPSHGDPDECSGQELAEFLAEKGARAWLPPRLNFHDHDNHQDWTNQQTAAYQRYPNPV